MASAWWQRGVIYQIYPRSFQDTNSDGIGDLRGIVRRLDYLAELGVDAIWISPIYPSPMADFGYDVSDYVGVDPMFGTLSDFDDLVAEAHGRGLKIVLDFVPNHTAVDHPWFIESRSSRSSAKRDWYIWRDAKPDGGPPNNWISNFGGSAWQWDATTGQYYYHAFLAEQPDLNWRNRIVREAMYEALRFWLRRGVDGFRVDVIWHLIKDSQFRDNPPNPEYLSGQPEIDRLLQVHSADQPEVHQVIAEMRSVIDEFGDRVLIGEVYLPLDRLVTYYGTELQGAQLPFNFKLVLSDWSARTIGEFIEEYEAALPKGAWPNWVLGNHDKPRIAARVGQAQARVAAVLLLTLRGTPTLYYGDELGLAHVAIPEDAIRDPWERNEPGHGFGRDPERTPMQWDATENAGFTSTKPWLPLSDDHVVRNVETMSTDPGSILGLYRCLLALRRNHRALAEGQYHPVEARGDLLAFIRECDTERLLVVLNLGAERQELLLSDDYTAGRVLLSTLGVLQEERSHRSLTIRPHEGVIFELAGSRP